MKNGARIALAIGVGYLLGRTRKMRLAVTLAVAGATGHISKNPADLVKRGTELLGSTQEIKTLTETARDRLVEAGKTAAVSAASNQIDVLSDGLQERARSLRRPRAEAAEPEEGEHAGDRARRREGEARETRARETDAPEAGPGEEKEPPRRPQRRPAAEGDRAATVRRRRGAGDDETGERHAERPRRARPREGRPAAHRAEG